MTVLVASRLFSFSEQHAAAENVKAVDYSGYDVFSSIDSSKVKIVDSSFNYTATLII